MKKLVYLLAIVMIVIAVIQQIFIHNLKSDKIELQNEVSKLENNWVQLKDLYEEVSSDYDKCLEYAEEVRISLSAMTEKYY